MAAVVFVAEIGDIRRFENPRQLMAFLGLVPSESSTGEHVKRGGIMKAGNSGPVACWSKAHGLTASLRGSVERSKRSWKAYREPFAK